VIQPGAVDGGKVAIVDAFEIDTSNFGSESPAAGNNIQRNGWLGADGRSHADFHSIRHWPIACIAIS
jgi:hypothetical protein